MRPPDIEAARAVLDGLVHRTPILRSESLSRMLGGEILTKAEHLQRTGSFKIRGAAVRIAALDDAARAAGVVTASAGNHAQGVAWAAARLGVAATIVMPTSASLAKVEATRGYGASVELHGETFEDAMARARQIVEERRATFVHPFDDPLVIAGQGTIGLEICEDVPHVDRVLVPVGGGGLAAGIATAVKALRPATSVVGVRPAQQPRTIADGAAVADLGEHTAPVLQALLDDVVAVDDEAISEAIVAYLERTKQVVEGAGALGLAALLAGKVTGTGTTLVVASGGNIDPGLLMRVIRHGLGESGRYLFVRVLIDDRPGQLRDVLDLLAGQVVNVVSVVHHRAGALPLGRVEVELTVETRDRAHADEVVQALRAAGYVVKLG
jgi:threonine dehydratase